MLDMLDWIETGYKPNWQKAYAAGEQARRSGLPRECNLTECTFVTQGGHILKVYKSAWEQGWDLFKIPEAFDQVEAALNQMPLRPMRDADI